MSQSHKYNESNKARGVYTQPIDSVAGMASDSRHMPTIPNSRLGTSVAPRLRPKPTQQTTITSSIALTLANSSSPKNIISPVPGATVECDKFMANFNDKYLGASMPRYSPNSAEGDPASIKFTAASTAVSPATLLSPFEQESMSTSTTVSIRPRPTTLTQSQQHILSNSNSEKSLVSPLSGSFTWNPFGDPSPFSPISTLTEDQLFGAEFDKLRLEGSQTSIVTSPEEMKSDLSVSYWEGSKRESLSSGLALGMIVSTEDTPNEKDTEIIEEDPFGSAPFTIPKRFKQKRSSSKLALKLSDRWRYAVGSGHKGRESLIESSLTETVDNGIYERPGNTALKEISGMEKSVMIVGAPKILMLDDQISSGEKGSPSFIKLPLDDRNKYEKLNSNDITSDDSDSEFYPEAIGSVSCVVGGTENIAAHGIHGCIGGSIGGTKRHSFKYFVENNIPEKLQAVYHKVDKSQIKNVQIVKKLRSKVVSHAGKDTSMSSFSSTKVIKERRKFKNNGRFEESDRGNASDGDSIGSASDLRANDDFPECDEIELKLPSNGSTRKKASFNRGACCGEGSVDDCISESIKTCGSSAYHAECESVTTNEDNSSRIVTRVRVKKRENLDSKHSVIDENDMAEEDMIQGEKPLLLDDELDYESAAENNGSSEEVLIDPFTPEDETLKKKTNPHECFEDDSEADAELDPFAMAPFRKPSLAKRSSVIKFFPEVDSIPEHYPNVSCKGPRHMRSNFITSKPNSSEFNDNFELPEKRLMALPEPLATPILCDKSPYSRRHLFETAPLPISSMLMASSSTGIGKNSMTAKASSPMPQHATPSVAVLGEQQKSFCVTNPHNYLDSRSSNNTGAVILTHVIPHNAIPVVSESIPSMLQPPSSSSSIAIINANRQISYNSQQHYNPHVLVGQVELSARRNYVNFSQIPTHNIGCISPDNNYVNFLPECEENDDVRNLKSDDYDDNSDSVVKTSSKSFLTKKQKVKYNYLHEKGVSSVVSNNGRDEVLISKVKLNVSGYRKVVAEGGGIGRSKKEESFSKLPKESTESCSKPMGFSNMSFEDFPSDELVDELGAADETCLTTGTTGSSKLMKMAPFEVIRNEKMLLEAEKKFGSLKRRSNPFS